MRIFVRVAEAGGFAETARHMNMSAPAVTRSVAALGIPTRELDRR